MKDFFKYTYSALHINNNDYDQFIIFKQYCSASKKSGVIKKGELIRIASKSGISVKKLYRLLNHFLNLNWIHKTNEGYILTSTNKINNNLNLKSKNHKEGFKHYPFFKVSANNLQYLEELKIYHLALQSSKRYSYHLPANTNADSSKYRTNKTAKENGFVISLDKLKAKGNYKSKTEVNKHLTSAAKIGLLNITKNGWNDNTNKFNCNSYTFNNYHYTDVLKEIIKPEIKEKKTVKRSATKYNESELKFKSFIDNYLVELVAERFIDSKYLTRKFSKRSYNKLLTKLMVSNSDLKNILLGFINQADITIESKLIEFNQYTMNYVQYLPKYYSDKEYGIKYSFGLNHSVNTADAINKVIDEMKTAKDNSIITKRTDYNSLEYAKQQLEQFRLQRLTNCI